MGFYVFVIFVVVSPFLLRYLRIKIKGKLGEGNVALRLSRLPQDDYLILNDVMIQNSNGSTSQIDHVVLSIYGIFVIETKNYTGKIYGSDSSEEWTKKIKWHKYTFRNPIKQNYGHVMALSELLGLHKNVFIPIVVFTSGASLRINTQQTVVYTRQLLDTIRMHRAVILTDFDIEDARRKILASNMTDRSDRRQHVKDIKSNVRDREKAIRQGICPQCGGKLITRQGQYGKFTGCSNYPRCKFKI